MCWTYHSSPPTLCMAQSDGFDRLLVLVVAIVILLPVLMMVFAWPMMTMWGSGHMWDGGMWNGAGASWMWLVMWIVPLVIFLGGGYLLYRVFNPPNSNDTDAALEELRLTYARGDLSEENSNNGENASIVRVRPMDDDHAAHHQHAPPSAPPIERALGVGSARATRPKATAARRTKPMIAPNPRLQPSRRPQSERPRQRRPRPRFNGRPLGARGDVQTTVLRVSRPCSARPLLQQHYVTVGSASPQ